MWLRDHNHWLIILIWLFRVIFANINGKKLWKNSKKLASNTKMMSFFIFLEWKTNKTVHTWKCFYPKSNINDNSDCIFFCDYIFSCDDKWQHVYDRNCLIVNCKKLDQLLPTAADSGWRLQRCTDENQLNKNHINLKCLIMKLSILINH